jgi:hypothetical protein
MLSSLCIAFLIASSLINAFPGKTVGFLNSLLESADLEQPPHNHKGASPSAVHPKTGLPELFLRDDVLLEEEK